MRKTKEEVINVLAKRGLLLGILPLIFLLLCWTLIAKQMNSYLLPLPEMILNTFYSMISSGELPRHVTSSLQKLLGGYLLAVVIGIPLGVLMGLFHYVERLCDLTIQITRPIPAIALIPLVILWLGLGYKAAVVIISFSAFYPIVLNTVGGVKGVEKQYLEFARTNGAGSWQVFTKVILPAALPDIVMGMRIGLGYGWRSLVGAEMLASKFGLGYLIMDARWLLQTERVILGIIVIGIVGWFIDALFVLAEKQFLQWRQGLSLAEKRG